MDGTILDGPTRALTADLARLGRAIQRAQAASKRLAGPHASPIEIREAIDHAAELASHIEAGLAKVRAPERMMRIAPPAAGAAA